MHIHVGNDSMPGSSVPTLLGVANPGRVDRERCPIELPQIVHPCLTQRCDRISWFCFGGATCHDVSANKKRYDACGRRDKISANAGIAY
jgi:hypothetical protein